MKKVTLNIMILIALFVLVGCKKEEKKELIEVVSLEEINTYEFGEEIELDPLNYFEVSEFESKEEEVKDFIKDNTTIEVINNVEIKEVGKYLVLISINDEENIYDITYEEINLEGIEFINKDIETNNVLEDEETKELKGLYVIIEIVDTTAPVIEKIEDFSVEYGTVIEDFKSYLGDKIKVTELSEYTIEVDNGGYNPNNAGGYFVIVIVTDEYGNKAKESFILDVKAEPIVEIPTNTNTSNNSNNWGSSNNSNSNNWGSSANNSSSNNTSNSNNQTVQTPPSNTCDARRTESYNGLLFENSADLRNYMSNLFATTDIIFQYDGYRAYNYYDGCGWIVIVYTID
jgi:hypothetical protein